MINRPDDDEEGEDPQPEPAGDQCDQGQDSIPAEEQGNDGSDSSDTANESGA